MTNKYPTISALNTKNNETSATIVKFDAFRKATELLQEEERRSGLLAQDLRQIHRPNQASPPANT